MGDAPICPTCHQPIRLDDSVYVWSDRRTMEHRRCHAFRRRLGISAEAQASADPVYGPMS
jgi:hypothetical protein